MLTKFKTNKFLSRSESTLQRAAPPAKRGGVSRLKTELRTFQKSCISHFVLTFAFGLMFAVGISAQTPTPTVQPTPQNPQTVPTPTPPVELPQNVPPIEPNFESPNRPLPSAERVGVDVSEQTPMTLNEAIALALENNTDIETSRIDVQISEFDLTAARGVYDPRLTGESFFQRSTTPTASTLGSSTGATTTTAFTNNLGLKFRLWTKNRKGKGLD